MSMVGLGVTGEDVAVGVVGENDGNDDGNDVGDGVGPTLDTKGRIPACVKARKSIDSIQWSRSQSEI